VGALCPISYFDSCVCPMPRISPNCSWVRSNPRICRIRRPIAFKSTRRHTICLTDICVIVVNYSYYGLMFNLPYFGTSA
jgi:hypothetical protein